MRKTIIGGTAALMITGMQPVLADHVDENCDLTHYVHHLRGATHKSLGNEDWRLCLAGDWLWETGNTKTCVKMKALAKRAQLSRGRAMSAEVANWYINVMGWYDVWLNKMHRETGKTRIGQAEVEEFCRANQS